MRIVIVDSDAQYIKIIEKTVRSLQKENENRGNEHEKAVCLAGAAQDGKAGYKLIREKEPDLVIMDLELPELFFASTFSSKMQIEFLKVAWGISPVLHFLRRHSFRCRRGAVAGIQSLLVTDM